MKQIVAPVLQLEQATRAISSGEYPERLPLETEDEIGDLARSFNQMVDVLKRVTGERERLLAETQNFNVALERRIEQVKRELKAAEDQLIRTEKLSAMGTLAAGVSHEISNPIHVIQGICSLILQDLEEGSQLTGDLQMIEREAARCQKIVNSLLDFARHHEPERRPTQVNRLVDESLDLIRAQKWSKKIELEKDLAELPEISVDGNRIKQVLINLLINAGQAMPNGGKLTVRTDLTPTGMDHLVRLRVCDTGAGIPKDIQPRIFDPFFTTKKGQEGTGLGLAISYRIVEEHGGTITVESEPGKGTCFTIVLPRSGGNGPAMKEGLV
ncbi:MAG: ATP-binding protein [Deltaproteobacteria bacterium]|nr:ATP-binding protein [Deltaproteobacteria bacterium]